MHGQRDQKRGTDWEKESKTMRARDREKVKRGEKLRKGEVVRTI